jgi:hypothetical protein
VDNKCLQQANGFKCIGCEIYYGNEKLFLKVSTFAQIMGILNNTFNPLTPKLNPSAQRRLARCFIGDFAS